MSQQINPSITRSSRHLGYALTATFLVAIAPVAVVATMPPFTSLPRYLSIIAGMVLSVAVTQAANFAWVKWFATGDLVFGDLMLWGWVRRVRVQRRVARVAEKVRVLEQPAGANALSIEAKTKILTDLVEALETRDSYTHGHSRRVTRHAFMIAKAMGLPPAQVERIRIAASVHDVGKLGIPLSIIRKPGKLTDDEFAQIAEHSVKGAELVAPLGDPMLTAIVRHHHERIDGSGYPDRLSGDAIPLGARIIAVADTFDAITSTRAYRKAARHSTALKIIRKEAGTQLDRDVVKAFLGYYSGRRSVEWWMVVTTLPQRAWAALGGWGRSAVAMPAVNGIAAAGTAALVATSLAPA
ncbi:MAG: HD-GYP domain-containing protein, partial [Actinomycetota bacterium]